jgi:hypothetical protein
MSLITGPEWERAVGSYLRAAVRGLPMTAERSGAPSEHTGGRLRYSSTGPADFQLRGKGWRVAVEVKKCDGRFPLAKVRPSQADDLDAAVSEGGRGLVVLRVAGDGPTAPDLVFMLDWLDLGPLWQAHADGIAPHGAASLSERDCAELARAAFGADGVRLSMDDHGAWTCPRFLPPILAAWGIE